MQTRQAETSIWLRASLYVPAGHAVGELAPEGQYHPLGHGTGRVLPAGQLDPAGHCVHCDKADSPTSPLYVPPGHSTLAPPGQYEPAGQRLTSVSTPVPTGHLYDAGHVRQLDVDDARGRALYVLIGHENHAPDMQYNPGVHGVWFDAVDPAGHTYPPAHALQAVVIPRLYEPAGH